MKELDGKLKLIQDSIDSYHESYGSVGDLNDGYHSFNDLYDHRVVLTALAFIHLPYAWKSKQHEDGSMFDGMFIVGAPTPYGMITYHYDMEYWDLFKIPSIPHAPHFDGHTPEDVIDRIKNFIMSSGSYLIDQNTYPKIADIVEDYILPVFGEDIVSKAAFINFYKRDLAK